MFRILLISFSCAVFMACSSDDSSALNGWFADQGIATSYGAQFKEIDVTVKSCSLGFDTSAYIVRSHAALGSVNGIEQSLYFGLEILDSIPDVWKFRTDSLFYADFYEGVFPNDQKELSAKIYWLKESKADRDSFDTWLKFEKPFTDSADISFKWEAGTDQDTFSVSLPLELKELKETNDTLRLLAYIKLTSENKVLRFAPSDTTDIPDVWSVVQKNRLQDIPESSRACQGQYLYSVAEQKLEQVYHYLYYETKDSLSVSFEMKKEDRDSLAGKAVVFAQLVFHKSDMDDSNSEFNYPQSVGIKSKLNNSISSEEYRIDEDYVKKYGHPNLVFWEGDSLKLQVTRRLRHYVDASDTLGMNFILTLGETSVLEPNLLYSSTEKKVLSSRPVFSRYGVSHIAEGKQAKLRLWFADF